MHPKGVVIEQTTGSRDVGADFRALHVRGKPFILANAWDIGTARVLIANGARAIGTSSAAHAFTLGRPDMGQVSRHEAISHGAELARAVAVPVSGDLENGFGPSLSDVKTTVLEAHRAGLAGCSIEDSDLPSHSPYEFDEAVARIEVAVSTARELPSDFVLCARADGIMNGRYDCDEAIRRLQAFEAVGADALYAPAPPTWQDLRRIIDSVEAPVNVLVAGDFVKRSYEDFASIGAARLSFGSQLARVTHRAIMNVADAVFAHGDFSSFSQSAAGDAVDRLLRPDS